MSLILDALKKSESERKSLAEPEEAPAAPAAAEPPGRNVWPRFAIGALTIAALGLGAYVWIPGAGPAPPASAPAETAPEPAPVKTAATTPPPEETKPAPEPAPVETAAATPPPEETKPAPEPEPLKTAATPPPEEARPVPEPAPTEPVKIAAATPPPVETKLAPKPEPVKTAAAAPPPEETKPAPEPEPVKTAAAPLPEEAQPAPEPAPTEPVKIAAATPPPMETKPAPKPEPVKTATVLPGIGKLANIAVPRKPPAPGLDRLASPRLPLATDALGFAERGRAFEEEGLYDRAIEEYTQAILLDPNYVAAYFGRGWAHEANGGHGPAVRNFSRAIELKPDFAEAYFGRGWAYEQRGETDRAIEEYTQAIRLSPGYADAYFSRGILEFYRGRMNAAAGDFSSVHEAAAGNLRDFALLWGYVSRARAGGAETGQEDAFPAFARLAGRDNWPGVLISMFLGEAGPADVIAAARHPDSEKQRRNECIAYFFLGQQRLIEGDKAGAAEYFRKTLATGVTNYRQFAAAGIELKRLGL